MVREGREVDTVTVQDVTLFDEPGTLRPHPASFPAEVLSALDMVTPRGTPGHRVKVLDPMAGIGRIHTLALGYRETIGVELEPEWAKAHERNIVGDARDLPFRDGFFDAVATSPPYANRLADNPTRYLKDTTRRTYAGYLGRDLTGGNAGALQWGQPYRDLMADAYREATRVLRPGGRFVLNVKDHARNGEVQGVTGWFVHLMLSLGYLLFSVTTALPRQSPGWTYGANAKVRCGMEVVMAFDRLP